LRWRHREGAGPRLPGAGGLLEQRLVVLVCLDVAAVHETAYFDDQIVVLIENADVCFV
jgi:hypothetical protein